MKPLPQADFTFLVRTDFSNDELWNSVSEQVREMPEEFRQEATWFTKLLGLDGSSDDDFDDTRIDLTFIDDGSYENITVEQLIPFIAANNHHEYVFLFDETTASHVDHPILVVDLYHERGRQFRSVPTQIHGIESNLSISNMDWEDFADSVDDDGIFRGFPE